MLTVLFYSHSRNDCSWNQRWVLKLACTSPALESPGEGFIWDESSLCSEGAGSMRSDSGTLVCECEWYHTLEVDGTYFLAPLVQDAHHSFPRMSLAHTALIQYCITGLERTSENTVLAWPVWWLSISLQYVWKLADSTASSVLQRAKRNHFLKIDIVASTQKWL